MSGIVADCLPRVMVMSVMTHRPRLPPMTCLAVCPMTVLPLAPLRQPTAVIMYGEPSRLKTSSNFDVNYYEPTTVKKLYLFIWTSTRSTSSESSSIWWGPHRLLFDHDYLDHRHRSKDFRYFNNMVYYATTYTY